MRAARWLLTAATACFLTACVPTPDRTAGVDIGPGDERPVTRFFLTSVASERSGRPMRYQLALQPRASAPPMEIDVVEDTFTAVAAWEMPSGSLPADPTVQALVTSTDSEGVVLRWRLQRTDRCGYVRAESPTVTVLADDPSAGSVSFFTDWAAGDEAVLTLEARRVAGDVDSPLLIEVGRSYVDIFQSERGPTRDASVPARSPVRSVLAETDSSGLGAGDFRWNNQRALWWNSHIGRWDAVLPTASPPADGPSNWWLWTDLGGEARPELALTSRPSSPDVHWNDRTCALSVFFSRDSSGTSRFHRYRYDPYTDQYVAEVEAVAVPSALRGSRRVTIVESPNGYLWAGVNHDGAVRVSRSTDGGSTWGEPVIIHRSVARGDNHWVVVSVGGSHRVGLAVTEDGGRVLFFHADQDEVDWHLPSRWTDESDSIPPPVGAERSDDELSAVAFQGEVFVVVETELGTFGRSDAIGLPQLVVYRRSTDGVWSSHHLATYSPYWEDDLKRPTIAIDSGSRLLLVAASRSDRRASLVLTASIDNLEAWSHHTVFEVDDATTQAFYNMRMPRHPVDGRSGLPVLVVEQVSGRLWRSFLPNGLS